MPINNFPSFGTFNFGKKTANAGTFIYRPVWPYRGQTSVLNGKPRIGRGKIHITTFKYTIGTTGHVITIHRPLNYTWFSASAAASQAVVNLYDNPGTFSTNYKYPYPPGATLRTADLTVSSGDVVAYQCADGTWVQDTVSSISTLALTLSNNVPTGGVVAGGVLYYYGPPPTTTGAGTTDPATAEVQPQIDLAAASSGTILYEMLEGNSNIWSAFNDGDPIILSSSNGTTAGTFEEVSGYYSKW